MIWLKIIVALFGAGGTGGLITALFDLQELTEEERPEEKRPEEERPEEERPEEKRKEKKRQIARKKLGLRYFRGKCRTWFPGLLGNVLLGGVAAVVFWSLYGPFSGATIIGVGTPTSNVSPNLTIGQLASSLLIGLSGAGFLLTEAKRRCAEAEN